MFMLLLWVSQTAEQHTSDAATTTTAAPWTVNTKELRRRFQKRVTHARLQGKHASATLETPP